jgi:hypothetical protein
LVIFEFVHLDWVNMRNTLLQHYVIVLWMSSYNLIESSISRRINNNNCIIAITLEKFLTFLLIMINYQRKHLTVIGSPMILRILLHY